VSLSLADAANNVAPVDFRRPSRISRDAVVALEGTHEVFARRLSTAWSAGSYAAIEVEHVATEQLSIDDFVRSLPVPTALATIRVGAMDAVAFLQVDLPFSLLYIERLLGGPGDPAVAPIARRPTDLEAALLTHELLAPAVTAIDEALRDLDGEPSTMLTFETAPQPLQLGSPGELLLLLTYRVEVRGELPGQGLVTLAYPVTPLAAQLEVLLTGARGDDEGASAASVAMLDALGATTVEVRVHLGRTTLLTSELARLRTGDVLRLDHPMQRPAELICDDRLVGTAHVGKRGRRVAAQIAVPPVTHQTRKG
jgi:flagellar motor switch protein FliM